MAMILTLEEESFDADAQLVLAVWLLVEKEALALALLVEAMALALAVTLFVELASVVTLLVESSKY
jgi:hypothetical protein